ncbi:hypothetical protein [Sneathiella sp.]|jgi:hypothetical protein|uniref:hypothetical protein n=1 Tax=Sneathiella sp. TaxID=1964365 RepID=UPI0039E2E190
MKSDGHIHLEPKIDEMFSDPIFLAVLKRDGLTINDVVQVIETYKQNRCGKPN